MPRPELRRRSRPAATDRFLSRMETATGVKRETFVTPVSGLRAAIRAARKEIIDLVEDYEAMEQAEQALAAASGDTTVAGVLPQYRQKLEGLERELRVLGDQAGKVQAILLEIEALESDFGAELRAAPEGVAP